MQVFKLYFKILNKQKTAMFIYIIVFFLLMLLIVNDFNKTTDGFEEEEVSIAVINYDHKSEVLTHFLNYLDNHFKIEEIETTDEAMSDALYYGKVSYILTIPNGYFDALITGQEMSMSKQYRPSSSDALSVDSMINSYLNLIEMYQKYYTYNQMEDLLNKVDETMGISTTVTLYQKDGSEKERSVRFYNNYYNFFSYIIVSCFITGIGMIMISFHNVDIRRRNLVSTMSPLQMSLQLILGNSIFCFGFVVLFMIISVLINPTHLINYQTGLFFLNTIIFSITALAMSYLVGITIKSRKAVTAVATALSLGMAFLGGAFVPQSLLGESVTKLASLTPVFWYIQVNDEIMGMMEYRKEDMIWIAQMMGIQIGFAVLFFTVILVVSQKKQRR